DYDRASSLAGTGFSPGKLAKCSKSVQAISRKICRQPEKNLATNSCTHVNRSVWEVRHFFADQIEHESAIQRKLLVLGDGACGKTSLLSVFTKGYFPQVYEPTVFENYVHDIWIDNQQIELSLWDTAGQEEFDRLRTLSYPDTHVIMLCFAVDNRDSLDNIGSKWTNELLEYCPGVKIVVVALKCDLREDIIAVRNMQRQGERPVTYEEGLAVARSIRASRYLECSAKHNRGVREAFEQAARVSIHAKANGSTIDQISGCVIL
ncbi:6092_t:CDS:2, partial [Acaulospora morrowiae]